MGAGLVVQEDTTENGAIKRGKWLSPAIVFLNEKNYREKHPFLLFLAPQVIEYLQWWI